MINYKNGYKKGYKVDYLGWHFDNDKFKAFIKKIKPTESVIDIGCGHGYMTEIIPTENIKLFDIDDFRGVSKQYPFEKIDISFDKLPLENESQDYVFSISVLEHVENQFNLLREADRVLKPGGRLILLFPNGWNILSRFLFLYRCTFERWNRDRSNHITLLPRNVFWRLLENYEKEEVIPSKKTNLFERLLYIFAPDVRGNPKIAWLTKIPIYVPSSEFWSMKICYILKKNIFK